MSELSWAEKVRLVHSRAKFRCEYCQTQRLITAQTLHIDHIDPQAGDDLDNLCLACGNCNQRKNKFTTGIDPVTKVSVPLFHPRK